MAKIVRQGPGFSEFKKRVEELEKLNAFVGWLESAMYDDGTPVAGIAAVNEYGSTLKGIPPRPFLRTATEENKQDWIRLLEQGSKQILNGKATAQQIMEILGLKIQGDIKLSIKAVTSPSLKQSTIDARRRKKANGEKIGNLTKPLVEEAIMINTVTYEVQ